MTRKQVENAVIRFTFVTMFWLAIAGIAILVTGCQTAPPPDQATTAKLAQAIYTDWLHADGSPPEVVWTEGSRCLQVDDLNKCADGLFLVSGTAIVEWPGSVAKSAFVHELIHAWLVSIGHPDPDHTYPVWFMEGRANQMLNDGVNP